MTFIRNHKLLSTLIALALLGAAALLAKTLTLDVTMSTQDSLFQDVLDKMMIIGFGGGGIVAVITLVRSMLGYDV